MPSYSSVQSYATERNQLVELIADWCLRKFSQRLFSEGIITEETLPQMHVSFSTDSASDVFDHYIEFNLTKSLGGVNGKIQLWAQTTCYKGNELGQPEPNKTYEIRETLVEALSLRQHLIKEGKSFRTLHFTFGPSQYTYGWFKGAKNNAFDLSLYSSEILEGYDIFIDLERVFVGVQAVYEVYEKLETEIQNPSSKLGEFIKAFINELYKWFMRGLSKSVMADKQASLLLRSSQEMSSEMELAVKESKLGGENIKGRAIETIHTGITTDHILESTLKRLFQANPFINKALTTLPIWDQWIDRVMLNDLNTLTLREAIKKIWQIQSDDALIARRLLIRLYAPGNVLYPADINVSGISEHNLYNGVHSSTQIEKIAQYLEEKYSEAGIVTSSDLLSLIKTSRSKEIIKESLNHDAKNGTTLKPSFYYIEEQLKNKFTFKSFEEMGLPKPIAYHSAFTTSRVEPYDNLKVVVDSNNQPIAIIKVKYFRKQEFPRRAKEEAYVGLTSKFILDGDNFKLRYDIPFVMFIDMDLTLIPPEFAVRRLVFYGWNVFFKSDSLIKFLERQ